MEAYTGNSVQISNSGTRFIVKRSELTTDKLFVEFYLPEYQQLLSRLSQSPYSLRPLRKVCTRMFDGPFGSNRKVDMYQDSGIPFVRVKDVLPGEIEQSGLTYISKEKHNELARSKVVPNNILLTIAGRVGTAAVFPDELVEGNITGHIVGLEVPKDINPHYLTLFLNSRFGEFQLTRLAHRTTRPELNLKEVGQVLVNIPPRPIQDRIAQIMQDAYAERQAKLAEAQALLDGIDRFVLGELGIDLESLLSNRFTTVNISEMQGQRFDIGPYMNQFDADKVLGSNKVSLSDIALLPRQSKTASKTPDAEILYIGMPDVDDITGEVNIQRLQGKEIKANKTLFKGGDVVFARIEPCIYNRKIALIPNDVKQALGSTELLVARAKTNRAIPEFLLWMLRSELAQRQIMGYMTGTTGRRRLPNESFASLQFPLVSLDKQQQIAEQATQRRNRAKKLKSEAEIVVSEAKSQVERMILGKDALA